MPSLAIVGARFRPPAEDVLRNLPAGADLKLKRQPENPYDENAIQVMLPKWEDLPEVAEIIEGAFGAIDEPEPMHLGFIPRGEAAKIAPQMDAKEIEELDGVLTFDPRGNPLVAFTWDEDEVEL